MIVRGPAARRWGSAWALLRISLLALGAAGATRPAAGREDGPRARFEAFAGKHYTDPVVEGSEEQGGALRGVVSFFRAFERANLAEDPLVPDEWIVTAKSIRSAHELPQALVEVGYMPASDTDAQEVAELLLRVADGPFHLDRSAITRRDDGSWVVLLDVTFRGEGRGRMWRTQETHPGRYRVTVGKGSFLVQPVCDGGGERPGSRCDAEP